MPTLKDIRRLVYKRQRKKNVIPEHAALTNKLNETIVDLREAVYQTTPGHHREKLEEALRLTVKEKQEKEESLFNELLVKLENYIIDQPKQVRLRSRGKTAESSRQITTFNKHDSTQVLFDRYCALRIADSFKVRSPGRDHCIRVLIDSLDMSQGPNRNQAKRTILRFDISDFFGSIPHSNVLEKLDSHAGIPDYIAVHVRSVLAAYNRIYDSSVGIPQGVPSSSVLSEVFMEGFDTRMRRESSIALFLRYVDDIVVICELSSKKTVSDLVYKELGELGLRINDVKGFEVLEHPNTAETSIDYLGYCFRFSSETSQLGSIDIGPGKKARLSVAFKKICQRMDAVECWANPEEVDFLLLLFDYLFLPHASDAGGDATRIVTGLAYNARFVRGKSPKTRNLSSLLAACRGQLESRSVVFGSLSSPPPFCGCCQRPFHRVDELRLLASRYLDVDAIFRSKALAHADDDAREDVRKQLWN